jgi:hypothetical protein
VPVNPPWPIPPLLPAGTRTPAGGRARRFIRLLVGVFLVLLVFGSAFGVRLLSSIPKAVAALERQYEDWSLGRKLRNLSGPSIAILAPHRTTEQLAALPHVIDAADTPIRIALIPYSNSEVARRRSTEFSSPLLRATLFVAESAQGWNIKGTSAVSSFWSRLGAGDVRLIDGNANEFSGKYVEFRVPLVSFSWERKPAVDSFALGYGIGGGIGRSAPLTAWEQTRFQSRYEAHDIRPNDLVALVLAETYFLAADSFLSSGSRARACEVLADLAHQSGGFGIEYFSALPEIYADHLRCLFATGQTDVAVELLKYSRGLVTPAVGSIVSTYLVEPILFDPFEDDPDAAADLADFPDAQLAFQVVNRCQGIRVGLDMAERERLRRWSCVKRVFADFTELLKSDSRTRRLALQAALQLNYSLRDSARIADIKQTTHSSTDDLCAALDEPQNIWVLMDPDAKRQPDGSLPLLEECKGRKAKVWSMLDGMVAAEKSGLGRKLSRGEPLSQSEKEQLLSIINFVPLPQAELSELRGWLAARQTVLWTDLGTVLLGSLRKADLDEGERALLRLAERGIPLLAAGVDGKLTPADMQRAKGLALDATEYLRDPMLSAIILISMGLSLEADSPALWLRYVDARARLLRAYPELVDVAPMMILGGPLSARREAGWLAQVTQPLVDRTDLLDALARRYVDAGESHQAREVFGKLAAQAKSPIVRDYYTWRSLPAAPDKSTPCFRVEHLDVTVQQLAAYDAIRSAMLKAYPSSLAFVEAHQLPAALIERAPKIDAEHSKKWERFAKAVEPAILENELPIGTLWLVVRGGIAGTSAGDKGAEDDLKKIKVFPACGGKAR